MKKTSVYWSERQLLQGLQYKNTNWNFMSFSQAEGMREKVAHNIQPSVLLRTFN